MKFVFISAIYIFFSPIYLYAQMHNKTIQVGDKIKILACKKGKELEHIDLYSRTEDYDHSKVNVKTGDGLYEVFFKTKNLEGKRLPCIMSGKSYKVAALEIFEQNGKESRVVLCYDYYHLNLIWIQLDEALKNHEIEIE